MRKKKRVDTDSLVLTDIYEFETGSITSILGQLKRKSLEQRRKDTVPHLKELSTSEQQQIQCKQQNHGSLQANDELLGAVQRKPDSFIGLLASLVIYKHTGLYKEMWNKIRLYFETRRQHDQIRILVHKVKNALPESQKEIPEAVNAGRDTNTEPPEIGRGPGTPIHFQPAPEICPRPEQLRLLPPEGMPTGNQSHGISPVLTSFSSDSAYSGSYKTQPSSEEEEQRGAKSKLGLNAHRTSSSEIYRRENSQPQWQPAPTSATPDQNNCQEVNKLGFFNERTSGGEVFKRENSQLPSQPSPTCAKPDQNNFKDMNLSKVRSKVLRAVGQDEEFVKHYQEVLDYIDIEISVEEEAKIEPREGPSPGYKVLQYLGMLQLPGGGRITVDCLSDALLNCNLDRANDILFGRADRRPPLRPSCSEGNNISQMPGAVVGSTDGITSDTTKFSEHMNIEFRSLPTETNMENQGDVQKITQKVKNLDIFSPRTDNITDHRSPQNIDARPDSLESNESNQGNVPSLKKSSNSSGNLPDMLDDPSLHSATSSYYDRRSAGENTMSLPISRGSSVHDDSFGNLKEYHGTPVTDQGSENAVPNPDADRSKLHKDFEEQLMGPSDGEDSLKEYPGRLANDEGKNAVHNPDIENRKLQEDVEHQSSLLGHSLDSHGYENLHSSEHSDSIRGTGNAESGSRLQTPALGPYAVQAVTPQNETDTGQQAPDFEGEGQQNEGQNTASEATTNIDEMVDLNTDSLCKEDSYS